MLNKISTILGNFAQGSPMIKGVIAAQAVEEGNAVLKKIYGAGMLEHAKVAYLKNKVLAIACLSSVAAQELRLHEAQFLDLLRGKIGKNVVEQVKYII